MNKKPNIKSNKKQQKLTVKDFQACPPTWCPGCGAYVVQNAIKKALIELGYGPDQALMTFDIGCNGNGADKINIHGFKGLHGRSLPLAVGASIANKNLPVIATTGDGGIYAEGINHLIHAIRSNYNISLIIYNNFDFGLTTGQATPTTPKDRKMNSSPFGVVEDQLNPISLMLSLRPSFLARGFSANLNELIELIRQSIQHPGFAIVDILTYCPTFNKADSIPSMKDNIYSLKDKNPNYDPFDYNQALQIANEKNKKATGIIFKNPNTSYLDRLPFRQNIETTLIDEVEKTNIDDLLKEFI